MLHRHLLSLATAAVAIAVVPAAAHAANASNNIGSAQLVTGIGPHTVTAQTQWANSEAGEPQHINADYAGKTVWVKWKPTSSGGVFVDGCGGKLGIGDTLFVRQGGPAFNTMTKPAFTALTSECRQHFPATANTTYYIGVDHSIYEPQFESDGYFTIQQAANPSPTAAFVDPPVKTGARPYFPAKSDGAWGSHAGYECEIDGQQTSCDLAYGGTPLASGTHAVRVRFRDDYWNRGPWSAKHTFVADADAPVITFGPAPDQHTATPSFTFSANEPVTEFTCSWDAGAYTPCTSPFAPPSANIGNHVLKVRATDLVGNLLDKNTAATLVWDRMYQAPKPEPKPAPPATMFPGGASTAKPGSAPGKPSGSAAAPTARTTPAPPCRPGVGFAKATRRKLASSGLEVRLRASERCVVELRLRAGGRDLARVTRTVVPRKATTVRLRPGAGWKRGQRLELRVTTRSATGVASTKRYGVEA